MWSNRDFLNRVLACVAVFLIASSRGAQTTWFVDDDNCPGPGSGTAKDPFCSIQDGIDAAAGGDEVIVADGTYTGPGNRDLDFGGKLITVRSANGPDNCIIDCQASQADPHRGFYFHSGETSAAIVQGFTITNGFATGTDGGGGICISNSNPSVTHCTFVGNTALQAGGGMYNLNSSPTVTDCTFSANIAINGEGGGMYNAGILSSPTVTNCTFAENSANIGGGMSNRYNGSPRVINCTFTGNTATVPIGAGGGMYNERNGSPTASNCTFTGNTASGSFGGGGGMYSTDVFGGHATPTLYNCILWGNDPDEIVEAYGAVTTTSYSDVQGGWPGVGNIDADPMFIAPGIGDNRLSSGSPCVDAGNNWGVPIDADDYDKDGNTAELFPVDLDGSPRFNADEADFDPGCGIPVVVDMGAYEYQYGPVQDVIFADLTGDGVVGMLDVLGVLAAWGDAANNCIADLDIDGDVGMLDLLTLLAHWG